MRYFDRESGNSPRMKISAKCYYHPIFRSKMALGAIVNELYEIPNPAKRKIFKKGIMLNLEAK